MDMTVKVQARPVHFVLRVGAIFLILGSVLDAYCNAVTLSGPVTTYVLTTIILATGFILWILEREGWVVVNDNAGEQVRLFDWQTAAVVTSAL